MEFFCSLKTASFILVLQYLLAFSSFMAFLPSILNQKKLIIWGAIPRNCPVTMGCCDSCFASLATKPMETASSPTWSYLVTFVCAGNLKLCFWGTVPSELEALCVECVSDQTGVRISSQEWKNVRLKCQDISNFDDNGMFYWWMSYMYRPVHMLIFCSHDMFCTRQKSQGRNTFGHEMPHSLSCCTQSRFQYGVCLVTACWGEGKRALRSIPSYWDPSGKGECANCYGSHWQNSVGQKLCGLVLELLSEDSFIKCED